MNDAIKILKNAIIEFQDNLFSAIKAQSEANNMTETAVFVSYEKAYSEAIDVFYGLLKEIDSEWDGKRIEKGGDHAR